MDINRAIQVSKAAEKFWILIVVASVGVSIWYLVEYGWDQQKQTLVLPGIAIAWYSFRRYFRKKLERDLDNHNSKV
tara:strand:+ start:9855 stop:10082 length:228 start_codon:yes stop_codon:yes gene_type:complete